MPEYVLLITAKAPATDATPTVTERLVRAKNEARAIAHVVTNTISIDRASTDDVVRLTKAGVELEIAE